MEQKSWSQSTDPVVRKVIDAAYAKADTGQKNPQNTSDTYDLTVGQVKEIMEEWVGLSGKAIEPQRRVGDKATNPNGYMLIHLNYKQNSYHVYLQGTQSGGPREAAFLKEWPNSSKLIAH